MGNVIRRDTAVIKVTLKRKRDGVKTAWLTRFFGGNTWVGSDQNGKGWWQAKSSELRNSDLCSIECFETFDDAKKAGMPRCPI